MIDVTTEQLLLLVHAPPAIPGHPSRGTLRKWAKVGIHGVVLETLRVGGRRFTSREAILRFFHKLNGQEETAVCAGSAAG